VSNPFLCVYAGCPTLIVDPFFQPQFQLGRNDHAYAAFLSTMPQLFVGTQGELEAHVRACAVGTDLTIVSVLLAFPDIYC
jgi:hypothetical protein